MNKYELSGDGSPTFYSSLFGEHFHSRNGAYTESLHIFVNAGLRHFISMNRNVQFIRIFEMGFGSGLNLLLSLNASSDYPDIQFEYESVEAYPIQESEVAAFCSLLDEKSKNVLLKCHSEKQGMVLTLSKHFRFIKWLIKLEKFESSDRFDLVYYDAFSPQAQPELWTEDIMKKIFSMMKPGGVLVTYCAQGQFKRNLKASGFTVERFPGPPGKKEITRAFKPNSLP